VRWIVLAAVGLLAWPSAQLQNQSTQAPAVSHPFTGVTYIDREDTTPRAVHLHVVQIDLRASGIRFKLSPAGGRHEVIRQTVLEFLTAERAQIAINAHFFYPWPTTDAEVDVIGFAASEGMVYSGFETPVQRFALLADAPALNIDRRNRAAVVHRDPKSVDGKRVRERVSIWTAIAGSAQIVTDGQVTIPQYRDEAHPAGALEPGGAGATPFSNARSWYDGVTARSAIGFSKDGRTLTLFTVDARGGSLGLTPGEVAALLTRDYGVWQALNLDGGGSTTLVMEDPVTHAARLVNTSSDNPAGRSVGSTLAVFARP
jgi:hypothetical protein